MEQPIVEVVFEISVQVTAGKVQELGETARGLCKPGEFSN